MHYYSVHGRYTGVCKLLCVLSQEERERETALAAKTSIQRQERREEGGSFPGDPLPPPLLASSSCQCKYRASIKQPYTPPPSAKPSEETLNTVDNIALRSLIPPLSLYRCHDPIVPPSALSPPPPPPLPFTALTNAVPTPFLLMTNATFNLPFSHCHRAEEGEEEEEEEEGGEEPPSDDGHIKGRKIRGDPRSPGTLIRKWPLRDHTTLLLGQKKEKREGGRGSPFTFSLSSSHYIGRGGERGTVASPQGR